ncbi:MAG: hypothetical protein KL787_10605 [Taibaiella sp.]|nr:hypothetical protein [Taibaiella sp.]
MKSVAKTKLNRLSLLFTIAILGIFSVQNVSAQYYDDYNDNNNGYYDDRYDNGDYQQFYDDLSPHGTWMQDPTYGYVWSPSVGRDFRPYYSNGHWAMTDLGNMWVSSYSWGWIPFHYGRWVFNDYYGWLWVPGRTWAPAWVVWRQNNAYYGWAPMGPSVSINFNFGNYYNSYYDYWNFIPCGNLYAGNYGRYRMRNVNYNFFNQTTIINNYHSHNSNRFFAGPRAEDVRRVTGRDVRTYKVSQVNTRGRTSVRGNDIRVYTPEIGTSRSGLQTAPRKVTKIESGRKTRIDQSVGNNYRSNVRTSSPKQEVRSNSRNTKELRKSEVKNSTSKEINRNNSKVSESREPSPKINRNNKTNREPQINRKPTTPDRNINKTTPQRNNKVNQQSVPKREMRSSAPQKTEMKAPRSSNRNFQSSPKSSRPQMKSTPRTSSPGRNMNNSRR